MNSMFSRRDVINKENIGQMANLKQQPKSSGFLGIKEIGIAEPPQRMVIENDAPSIGRAVSQYVDTIIRHICAREEAEPTVNPEYMSLQRDITTRMRAILVDWLVDVNLKFKMKPQTFFMTVGIIDRFLAVREVTRQRLQLVGVAALMIVGKYEEIYPPLLKDYVAVCDNAFTREEMVAMESEILLALDFDLNKTCCFVFLEYFRERLGLQERVFVFCRYLLENALLDASYLRFNQLTLATGAILLVNKIFKKESWPLLYEQVSGVSESRAKACAKELFAMISRADFSPLTAIKRKFAEPEMFEVSKYKIEKVPAPPSQI